MACFLPKGPMVAEPDAVKLIKVVESPTGHVVVLKLGDDSDVWARTFDTKEAAIHYADVCSSLLNGEDVEYTEQDSSPEAEVSGQDEADSWDDDSDWGDEEATPAPAAPSKSVESDVDSWDDDSDWGDEDETPAPAPASKAVDSEADSWDELSDWGDEDETSTPVVAPKAAEPEADSWDDDSDWDDDPKPEKKSATKSKSQPSPKSKNKVKAEIKQQKSGIQEDKDTSKTKSPRASKAREALSFTPVDDDSDAWSPEWGDDSAEDWHDDL